MSAKNLEPTLTLRLPRAALARRDAITRLAATWQARKLFALKCDELDFARALSERRSNLWIYRTSQRAFAGDFVVVDVSSPKPAARSAYVVELKTGEPVRVSDPTSVQLRNAPAALRELAGTGVVTTDSSLQALTGSSREVLAFLGVS